MDLTKEKPEGQPEMAEGEQPTMPTELTVEIGGTAKEEPEQAPPPKPVFAFSVVWFENGTFSYKTNNCGDDMEFMAKLELTKEGIGGKIMHEKSYIKGEFVTEAPKETVKE